MRRLSAVFLLVTLAPAVAIGQRPLSAVARAVADLRGLVDGLFET